MDRSTNLGVQKHHSSRQLWIKVAMFFALLLFGVELGVSYSHMMQWIGKSQLPLATFLAVQTTLIQYKVGLGVVEIGSFLSLTLILKLSSPKSLRFRLAIAAMSSLVLAFLVWVVFIEPINAFVDAWTENSYPADWTQYRERWHSLHLVRLLLLTVGMSSLASSAISQES